MNCILKNINYTRMMMSRIISSWSLISEPNPKFFIQVLGTQCSWKMHFTVVLLGEKQKSGIYQVKFFLKPGYQQNVIYVFFKAYEDPALTSALSLLVCCC